MIAKPPESFNAARRFDRIGTMDRMRRFTGA